MNTAWNSTHSTSNAENLLVALDAISRRDCIVALDVGKSLYPKLEQSLLKQAYNLKLIDLTTEAAEWQNSVAPIPLCKRKIARRFQMVLRGKVPPCPVSLPYHGEAGTVKA